MSGNSKTRRKAKRSNLKVQRKEAIKIEREQERKQPNDKDRFTENPTLSELFEYMKSQHLKH